MPQGLKPKKESKARIALRAILRLETIKNLAKEHSTSVKKIRHWKKEVLDNLFPEKIAAPPEPQEPQVPPPENLNLKVIGGLTSVLDRIDKRLKHYDETQKKSNRILLLYTIATILMVVATGFMASVTKEMAHYTEEMAQWDKRPTLDIHFLIQSESKLRPKIDSNEGIGFTVKKYLIHRDDIKFHVAVNNNWDVRITEKLKVTLKCTVIDDEGGFLSDDNEKWQKEEEFDLRIAPYEYETFPVEGMKDWLLNDLELLNNKLFSTGIIKLEISGLGISIDRFPYASFEIYYERFKNFRKSWEVTR